MKKVIDENAQLKKEIESLKAQMLDMKPIKKNKTKKLTKTKRKNVEIEEDTTEEEDDDSSGLEIILDDIEV